jgi:uncharacterized membrane protein YbaN (DUF454 family)
MKQQLMKCLLFFIACLATIAGVIGIVLPLLPATPFFIFAVFAFSKSAPRFQHFLLTLPIVGDGLKQWQVQKRIDRKRKPTIYISIIVSFFISIYFLMGQHYLQLLLVILMLMLLIFIKKLPEY